MMTDGINPPAPRPCGSCPYRQDVPSGVWEAGEYEKLPNYDGETFEQPPSVFMCHQQDGKLCAGWVGCHDMDHSLALRMACAVGEIGPDDLDKILDYETDVPLWPSGAEAAEHGLRELEAPSAEAERLIANLQRKGLAETGPAQISPPRKEDPHDFRSLHDCV